MNVRIPMGVLHYDKMDLRLFYFGVTIYKQYPSTILIVNYHMSTLNPLKYKLDDFPKIVHTFSR